MDLPSLAGLVRSLLIYRARPGRLRRMAAFYRPLVPPGSLCIDVGAHVGDRVAVFRRLGARVLAVEPQPHLVALLRRLHGRDGGVTILPVALGEGAGTADLRINRRNPTLSTLSAGWAARVGESPRFPGERWEGTVPVPVETLDAVIARYGGPAFIKVDVEGLEPRVLAGLTRPVPALSFEFLPESLADAVACVGLLCRLGDYRFAASRGESFRFDTGWLDAAAIQDWLHSLPPDHPGGDIYARRHPANGPADQGP